MTPNDPRLTFDPQKRLRVSSLCICMSNMNILWKIEELLHFKWKSKFDHYDPKMDPRLTFNPITQVEGLKLMNMYESYGHAM